MGLNFQFHSKIKNIPSHLLISKDTWHSTPTVFVGMQSSTILLDGDLNYSYLTKLRHMHLSNKVILFLGIYPDNRPTII